MATKYNFDEIIDRRGTNSVKWDLATDAEVLPMWVADMDFKTAPEITEAILNKVSDGLFGYGEIPENYFPSIIGWWKEVHHFNIKEEWLLSGPGMIPTLSAVVRTFVRSGESIIIQPPVYNHFYNTVENCNVGLLENKLIYENGIYRIDYDDLEIKASDPDTRLLLLCNPHNPVGRVWQREELERIAKICSQHNVIVVSDEIHADLVFDGNTHIPFITIAENYDLKAVTCGSPCKTFNLAGLPISYLIGQNQEMMIQIHKTFTIQETSYPNPIAVEALIAGYTRGKVWMDELKVYLYENYQYLLKFIGHHLPEIKVLPLEATYLVWLDCSSLNKTSEEITKVLLEEYKLWLNPGTLYGNAGEGFLRMNIGCPRELLEDGLQRLSAFYRGLK
jgi:cystathionine beta-lyase